VAPHEVGWIPHHGEVGGAIVPEQSRDRDTVSSASSTLDETRARAVPVFDPAFEIIESQLRGSTCAGTGKKSEQREMAHDRLIAHRSSGLRELCTASPPTRWMRSPSGVAEPEPKLFRWLDDDFGRVPSKMRGLSGLRRFRVQDR
jgi:hypothetical protein